LNKVKGGKLNEKVDLSIFKDYELLLVVEAAMQGEAIKDFLVIA